MAKKPEPPKPTSWTIYKIASKAVWLEEVGAPDEAPAIEKAAAIHGMRVKQRAAGGIGRP
jgi:hypothetical protein